ncbi:stalk domain-containing protein [Ammoniphilus sp. YIM 78166]|uniref:stalk domain-containing protein n=1 Tax=Ammoniphilus sp. YIM 78166 TaxID=1644106 RepID=UPI00142F833A|nr:stalk domain-containing protein [Ammoniphilus sp. YIM 78166]
MNKTCTSFVIGFVVWLLVSFAGQAETHQVDIKWNGKSLETGQVAYVKDGIAWAPVREVAEAVGAKVSWNQRTRMVTAVKGSTTLTLQAGSDRMQVNGKSIRLPAIVKLEKGRTVAPIRVITEALGAKVEWIGLDQAVYITEAGKISVKEAEERIRKQLGIGASSKTVVEFDHLEGTQYGIHVYDLMGSHTATRGWYYVDLHSGKVDSMF